MKTIAIAVAMLIGFAQSEAQTESREVKTMGGGGFTIGYGYMDISPLNRFMSRAFPTLSPDHTIIGGTGHGIVDRMVLGGSGAGIIGDHMTNDSLKANVGGGSGTFDFGYLIYDRKHLKIFPLIGVGGFGYGLKIAETRKISAGQVSDNPSHEIQISCGGLVTDLSMSFYLLPRVVYNTNDDACGGFMIGLRVGYLASIPTSNWNYAGGEISNAPRFGMNMAYVKLIFGGFGSKTKTGWNSDPNRW